MTDMTGRAGFDVRHAKRPQATRTNRKRVVEESARHIDEMLTAKQADRNENVDPKRTPGNVLWVNDGDGGLKVGTIDEALDYGDERTSRVRRKMTDKTWTTTTLVAHLPKTLCQEQWWIDPRGQARRFYEATDEEEMRRYFEVAIEEIAKALPGGMESIHGVSLNLDEYTPHIHVLADTYAEDDGKKAKPGDLRVAWSDAWGESRRATDAEGKMPNGKKKITAYQAAFRQRMVDEGFPVELDPDPIRSKRKQSKQDFIELDNRRQQVEKTAKQAEANKARNEKAEEKIRRAANRVQDKFDEAKTAGYDAGHAEGFTAGVDAGNAAVAAALAQARKMADEAEKKDAAKERELNEARLDRRASSRMFEDAKDVYAASQDAAGAGEAHEVYMDAAKAAGASQAVLEALRRARTPAVAAANMRKKANAARMHTLEAQLNRALPRQQPSTSSPSTTTKRPEHP